MTKPPLHMTRCKRLRFTPSKFCLRGTSFTPNTFIIKKIGIFGKTVFDTSLKLSGEFCPSPKIGQKKKSASEIIVIFL